MLVVMSCHTNQQLNLSLRSQHLQISNCNDSGRITDYPTTDYEYGFYTIDLLQKSNCAEGKMVLAERGA
jgi:hypothetical protein